MTDEELAAHREKMRSLDTRKERWEYRKERRENIFKRAKEQGVDVIDCPRQGKWS